MGKVLIAALCLITLPFKASAQDLAGRWEIAIPSLPPYAATVLIDSERRALFDDDRGASWRGYVAHVDSTRAEMVITSGAAVAHVLCKVEARGLLYCHHRRQDGSISNLSVLTRIGDGPQHLTSALR